MVLFQWENGMMSRSSGIRRSGNSRKLNDHLVILVTEVTGRFLPSLMLEIDSTLMLWVVPETDMKQSTVNCGKGGSEWCIQTWSVEASSCVSSCHCHCWTDQVWEWWFSAFPSVQIHRSSCFLRIPTILLVVHYHHDVLYLLLLILLFSPEVSLDLCSQQYGGPHRQRLVRTWCQFRG